MSAIGAYQSKYQGGLCYALCNETFTWYNPSINMCWKGCDFALGRMSDPTSRKQAEDMCKRYTSEIMWTSRGELDNLEDLRVHDEMYPTKPENIYKACLAGVRRQKF